MEFVWARKPGERIRVGGREEKFGYSHALQFYSLPPTENITLNEFEELATERLKVLKVVETLGVRHIRGSNDYREAMKTELRKLANDGILKGLTRTHIEESDKTMDHVEDRRRDHISHFILRLAYCKTEDLRRWFIMQEVDLFRFRFQLQSSDAIQKFLNMYNLAYTPISREEKTRLHEKLISSRYNMSAVDVDSDKTDYYKVRFTEVLELVRGMKVYLEKGYAFVPQMELVVIIVNAFRSRLSHDLVIMSRGLHQLSEEERLMPMLSNLSRQYLGQDYSNRKATAGNITADMVESLSKTAFPLCMQTLHQSLRQHHHLKHWGRQQYGLFLKGIGLSLEEALRFWRLEFIRIMDGDKFDKQYAYNIRHNYGKEGKRADYTPYSCVKIITTNPPTSGDFHGCPFRHFEVDLLRQRLQSFHLPSDGINEILDFAKQGHYQLACGRHFELRNNTDIKFAPQHPNQYFEESQKLGKEVKTIGAAAESHRVTLVPVENRKKDVPPSSGASVLEQESLADNDESCWEEMDISLFNETDQQQSSADNANQNTKMDSEVSG